MAYYGGVEAERPWPVTAERAKVITVLLAALTALAIAAYTLVGALGDKNAALIYEEPAVSTTEQLVLVAREHIPAGSELKSSMFRARRMTVEAEKARLYVPKEVKLKGTFTRSLILAGDPITREMIAIEKPVLADVSMSIPEGFRAVSIPVTAESGVEGWVRPGAYVDIVWTTEHRGKELVSIIVENARVLSAGGMSEQMFKERQKMIARGEKPTDGAVVRARYVTLMVSLEDSQKVNLAKTTGTLSLSLRGVNDQDAAGDNTITVDKLLSSRGVVLNDQVTGVVSVNGEEFEIRDDGSITQIEGDRRVVKSDLAKSLRQKRKVVKE